MSADEAPAPGMKLLKKKDEELEGLFAGSGRKGKGAKREAARAAAGGADKGVKVRGGVDPWSVRHACWELKRCSAFSCSGLSPYITQFATI